LVLSGCTHTRVAGSGVVVAVVVAVVAVAVGPFWLVLALVVCHVAVLWLCPMTLAAQAVTLRVRSAASASRQGKRGRVLLRMPASGAARPQ